MARTVRNGVGSTKIEHGTFDKRPKTRNDIPAIPSHRMARPRHTSGCTPPKLDITGAQTLSVAIKSFVKGLITGKE